jgi:hypothetical protein
MGREKNRNCIMEEEGLEVGYEIDSPAAPPVQLNDPYPFNRN